MDHSYEMLFVGDVTDEDEVEVVQVTVFVDRRGRRRCFFEDGPSAGMIGRFYRKSGAWVAYRRATGSDLWYLWSLPKPN